MKGTYADVGVHHKTDAKEAVKNGVGSGRGDKGGSGERYEGCSKDALEGPVI